MILGDSLLKEEICAQNCISEYSSEQIGPASIDITLGDTFLVPKWSPFGVTLGGDIRYRKVHASASRPFKLRPGQFVLATTHEMFILPDNLSAFVHGRSTIGRIGLSIVADAGFVDPGFCGEITLELKNESKNTIYLKPGYRIGQLVFIRTDGVETPYHGRYQGQIGATGARMLK